mgnify:CR=1 FL=1
MFSSLAKSWMDRSSSLGVFVKEIPFGLFGMFCASSKHYFCVNYFCKSLVVGILVANVALVFTRAVLFPSWLENMCLIDHIKRFYKIIELKLSSLFSTVANGITLFFLQTCHLQMTTSMSSCISIY